MASENDLGPSYFQFCDFPQFGLENGHLRDTLRAISRQRVEHFQMSPSKGGDDFLKIPTLFLDPVENPDLHSVLIAVYLEVKRIDETMKKKINGSR